MSEPTGVVGSDASESQNSLAKRGEVKEATMVAIHEKNAKAVEDEEGLDFEDEAYCESAFADQGDPSMYAIVFLSNAPVLVPSLDFRVGFEGQCVSNWSRNACWH
jgi:hypothetical protein